VGVAEVSEPREHAGAVGVDGGAGATTWLAKSMKSRPPGLYGMASGYPVRSRFSMGDTNDHHRDGADQNARGSCGWASLVRPRRRHSPSPRRVTIRHVSDTGLSAHSCEKGFPQVSGLCSWWAILGLNQIPALSRNLG